MSEEKVPTETNTSDDTSSKVVETTPEPHHHFGDGEMLELKKHSSAEIESSGKWYDKSINCRWFHFRYSNSMVQIVMLSFVVFMTPGMFNALSGIGASISDVKTSDNAQIALYSTFATIGFFAGTICNYIGVRASLMFGGVGYALYAGSLLSFQQNQNKGFVIFAGAFLGICAATLWAAQGTIIMSYPAEDKKGRAIMVFWVIFNLGGVIGSIIPLANNLHSNDSKVNDGTFIAFIVLMVIGIVIAFFMLPVSKVWKANGTRVATEKSPNWFVELKGMGRVLYKEPKIYFMFPMFFASNWFYTYQFNDFNAGRFNLRTRSLNSLLYWLSQMIGAIIIGLILDLKYFKRSTRARIGFVILFVLGLAIWGGGLKFQLGFTRADVKQDKLGFSKLELIDFKHVNYVGPMFLYMFYGGFDAMFQSYIFWTLGALSNNPKKTSLYAGFYKGIQSAGGAVAWALDSHFHPYMDLFISSWVLVQASLLIAVPLIFFCIKETTLINDDDMQNVINENELLSVKSEISQVENAEDAA